MSGSEKQTVPARVSLSPGEKDRVRGSGAWNHQQNADDPESRSPSPRPPHSGRGRTTLAIASLALAAVACALLLISLKLPLWQMRLEAPQYRGEEALHISVHPNALHGDLRELSVLNQYIGVHVPPTLPQFTWLPAAIVAGAVLAICAALLPFRIRRLALIISAFALMTALATAAIQATFQIYNIGHNRDRHTPLVGVEDFTPPFLGTSKIAQFEARSRFGLGAWLIGGALALQFGAAWLSGNRKPVLEAGTSRSGPSADSNAAQFTSVTT